MSGLRKSTRIRKPVTTIDQNLDDEDDHDAFIAPKMKKSIERLSNKRPSTDVDNDESDFITPKKRQRKKPTEKSTAKTSPYFNTKPTEKKSISPPKKETKKTRKPRAKKVNISIDENTTLSNDATSVTTKSKLF